MANMKSQESEEGIKRGDGFAESSMDLFKVSCEIFDTEFKEEPLI